VLGFGQSHISAEANQSNTKTVDGNRHAEQEDERWFECVLHRLRGRSLERAGATMTARIPPLSSEEYEELLRMARALHWALPQLDDEPDRPVA